MLQVAVVLRQYTVPAAFAAPAACSSPFGVASPLMPVGATISGIEISRPSTVVFRLRCETSTSIFGSSSHASKSARLAARVRSSIAPPSMKSNTTFGRRRAGAPAEIFDVDDRAHGAAIMPRNAGTTSCSGAQRTGAGMEVLGALVVSLAVFRAIGAHQLPELFMVSSTNNLRMREDQRPNAPP